MRSHNYFPLVALALAGAAGCGGVTADQACSDSSKAQCAILDRCKTNGTQNAYGTLGNCETRIKTNCLVAMMAANTGNSPSATEACANALPNEACQDYLQANPVAACVQQKGSLPNGMPCAFNAQCMTGFCGVPKGMLCGTCANLPAPGDPCTDVANCGPNQTCTPMQTCQPYTAAGGACDGKNIVCQPGFACVIPAMMTMGTCQQEGSMVGQACDSKSITAPTCNSQKGLFCPSSGANAGKCQMITYVKAGAACGGMMMGAIDDVCSFGSSCSPSMMGMTRMCQALGQEGDACDLDLGPNCMSPDRCVVSGGGTAGTCTAPDPTMCGMATM